MCFQVVLSTAALTITALSRGHISPPIRNCILGNFADNLEMNFTLYLRKRPEFYTEKKIERNCKGISLSSSFRMVLHDLMNRFTPHVDKVIKVTVIDV